jgi:hypothetical protein
VKLNPTIARAATSIDLVMMLSFPMERRSLASGRPEVIRRLARRDWDGKNISRS